mgnify:CR=1 FL=1
MALLLAGRTCDDLRSRWFEPSSQQLLSRNNPLQVIHTCVPLTKQYNLFPASANCATITVRLLGDRTYRLDASFMKFLNFDRLVCHLCCLAKVSLFGLGLAL